MPKKDRFVLIDGNALVHRAFHAIPELTTKSGQHVNAVYGFVSILLRVLKDLKPEYVAAAFDRKEKTFRHEMSEDYKATRVKAPDELYEQIPIVKEVLDVLNIPVFEKAGFEADDVIGTLAKKHANGTHVTIVSGDHDLLQLVNDNIDVYTMKRSISDVVIYDGAGVKERYQGLTPEQLVDYKALAGDSSDNIPGVKGVGDKTAIALLTAHKNLERLYKDVDAGLTDDMKPRVQALLTEHKKDAFMSKELATIQTDVPVKFTLQDALLKDYDHNDVVKLFQELEFRSLVPRVTELADNVGARGGQQDLFGTSSAPREKPKNKKYHLVQTEKELVAFVHKLAQVKVFALDTETDSLDSLFGGLVGASFSWKKHEGYYVDYKSAKKCKSWSKLVTILENPTQQKIGHNIKYDLEVLRAHEIDLQGIAFDTMIASYLLNAGARQNKLSQAAIAELGYEMQPIEELIGKGKDQKSMADVAVEDVSWYACEDADVTWQLYKPFKQQIQKEGMDKLMKDVEVPLISVLATMEQHGALIDVEFLQKMHTSLAKRIAKLEKDIHKHAGHEFNIASPKQLSEVLFEGLDISTHNIKKTKTGISTSASELEKLRGVHPIIERIMQYRELTKLQSTYVDALPKMIAPKTGRVHTSFNQTIAATGRLSSSDPNLQNIPIRTEEGREIRKAFIARRGYSLLAIDYSQIELRVVAALAKDNKMIETFQRGEDIHTRTAAEIHGVEPADVTKDMRRSAKEVNFGVLYGMGAFGLASRTGISHVEAQEFIEQYFASFPSVREYVEQTKIDATQKGYAETRIGRRRYLPEIKSHNHQLRRSGERMAINMPVQGLAADILKLAMIDVNKQLPSISQNTKMILQVHDELVFEVPTKEVKTVCKKIVQIMEDAYTLAVPIKAEGHAGKNWGEMEPVTRDA